MLSYIFTFFAGAVFGALLFMIVLLATLPNLKDHERDPYQ